MQLLMGLSVRAAVRAATPPGWRTPAALAFLLATWLLGTGAARASDPDPWLGRDKALHFAASGLLAGGGYATAGLVTEDRRWRVLAGLAVGLGAGFGKEAVDALGHGDPSWRDLSWDILGAATGTGLAYLIDLLLSSPSASPSP